MAGRPEHKYNEVIADKIKSLLTFGIAQKAIASHVGLASKTLVKHYSEVIDNTVQNRDAAVEHALFYQATVLNIPASTIFYLKTRIPEKYGEKQVNEQADLKADIMAELASKLPD